MNFNSITSDLRFCGCSIRELKVENNIVSLSDGITKRFGMDVVLSETSIKDTAQFGKLLLKTVVELEENGKNVCTIELLMEGSFSAPLAIKKDEFQELIEINGATALYSIARSKIEMISASTFLEGKIILPFVNIYDFYKDKHK